MTDEELEALIKDVSGQLEQLSADPEKSLSKEERKRKVLLQAKSGVLDRIKKAREKGNFSQEVRACIDYGILEEYGEKNPLLINFMRSQMGWWGL